MTCAPGNDSVFVSDIDTQHVLFSLYFIFHQSAFIKCLIFCKISC